MDFLTALEISGSALKAQRIRLNVGSMNMANANTTRTMEGGPYRAKSVVFQAMPVQGTFAGSLADASRSLNRVEVAEVKEDTTPFKEVYDPSHPDADENGIVTMPNVNTVEQLIDIMEAQRDYGANVSAMEAAKSMALKALDIGR